MTIENCATILVNFGDDRVLEKKYITDYLPYINISIYRFLPLDDKFDPESIEVECMFDSDEKGSGLFTLPLIKREYLQQLIDKIRHQEKIFIMSSR
jgi:hypothetical protein